MFTIQSPPGHPGQQTALIAFAFLEKQLTIDAPDPSLLVRSSFGYLQAETSTTFSDVILFNYTHVLTLHPCCAQSPVLKAQDHTAHGTTDILRYGACAMSVWQLRLVMLPAACHASLITRVHSRHAPAEEPPQSSP